jgi:hypothetical protein
MRSAKLLNIGWEDSLRERSWMAVGNLFAGKELAAWGVTFSVDRNGDY